MTKIIIDTDKNPKIPYDGWKVEKHIKMGKIKWEVPVLHLEPEQEKGYLNGNTLRERLKGKPVLNANVLDYLLEHTELIPEEWKGKCIFFWGTIYRNSGGYLYVRCLLWIGDSWDWDYYWLDNDWGGSYTAALRASLNLETKNSLETLPLVYADLMRLAHNNNQVVGEKNDYYITLEQLENALMKMEKSL